MRAGKRCRNTAATPATLGVAKLVPEPNEIEPGAVPYPGEIAEAIGDDIRSRTAVGVGSTRAEERRLHTEVGSVEIANRRTELETFEYALVVRDARGANGDRAGRRARHPDRQ